MLNKWNRAPLDLLGQVVKKKVVAGKVLLENLPEEKKKKN